MDVFLRGWGLFMGWLLKAEQTKPSKPQGIQFFDGEPRQVRLADGRWAGKLAWLFPDGSVVPHVAGAANFWRRNVSKAFWVPTISNINAPTATEVNAGTEMTGKMADIAGFTYQNQAIPTPTWGTSFNSVIPGEDQVQASSITFHEDKTTNPLRTTLAKGTVGYVVIFFAGTAGASPAAGDKAEVWPCISAGPVRLYTFGNENARWRADLTPNAVPATDAVLV